MLGEHIWWRHLSVEKWWGTICFTSFMVPYHLLSISRKHVLHLLIIILFLMRFTICPVLSNRKTDIFKAIHDERAASCGKLQQFMPSNFSEELGIL